MIWRRGSHGMASIEIEKQTLGGILKGKAVDDHRKAHHFRPEMIIEKCTT